MSVCSFCLSPNLFWWPQNRGIDKKWLLGAFLIVFVGKDVGRLREFLSGTRQLSWGARPPRAQWAAPSRPTRHAEIRSLFGVYIHAGVRREGAPNSSRGGCDPHSFGLHRSGLERI